MCKIHIVGNPNSGKTTLFNSLTKSSEHVGNWHGVTVESKSKFIKFDNVEYEIVDLPGIYSLNAFSLEEQVSIDAIDNADKILYLLDANNFKRSLLLAINLLLKNKNIKILVNNYQYFEKKGGQLDIEYLKKILGCEVEIVNAKKIKPNKKLFEFNTKQTSFIKMLKNQTKENDNYKNIEIIYNFILKISNNCINYKKIYGFSLFDSKYLKLSIFLPAFILIMFFIVYATFFLIGPLLSDVFLTALHYVIETPVMAIISRATRSKFVLAFFKEGVFGACFSVLGFLPQICLMYLFLSLLENSGIISRIAYIFDDWLEHVGLNGKMVYTLLMGLGCSTTATMSAQNMPNKNAKIKASLLTPFISCSAKLPIYTTVGLAILGVKSIWLIFGLYLLGIIIALVFAVILEKTFLPSESNQFLIEFPPLKFPNLSNLIMSIRTSCKQFIVKVFAVIFSVSMLIWILSNINIKFKYVGDSSLSILYSFSSIISWIFKPIGLNNPNIICALIIGLVAKELILSSFAISNKVGSLALLGASLTLSSSAVNFNIASGVAFLVFTLLYCPCISNIGVLIKEIGYKYTLLGCSIQFGLAYLLAFMVYSIFSGNLVKALVILLLVACIIFGLKIMYKKIKSKKLFNNCMFCNRCKK